jgi:hypothetical protein
MQLKILYEIYRSTRQHSPKGYIPGAQLCGETQTRAVESGRKAGRKEQRDDERHHHVTPDEQSEIGALLRFHLQGG